MSAFPTTHQLWSGVLLSTIAHAAWILADPLLSYEKSWDGSHYNVQNSMGARGTVTFAGKNVIGVFFDEHSPRNPLHSETTYHPLSFFKGARSDIWTLAQNETMQYILSDYRGTATPLLTSAFWNDGEYITAVEPWTHVLRHGAHLIHTETLRPQEAIIQLSDAYEFSPTHVAFVQSLYEQKMKKPHSKIVVARPAIEQLRAYGEDGIIESRNLLASIGIYLP